MVGQVIWRLKTGAELRAGRAAVASAAHATDAPEKYDQHVCLINALCNQPQVHFFEPHSLAPKRIELHMLDSRQRMRLSDREVAGQGREELALSLERLGRENI